MNMMYFFVGAAVIGAIMVGLVFLWALRSGQFDDLEGPAYRILFDEDDPMLPGNRQRAEEARSRADLERGKDQAPGPDS
ncbi:cbb3-type cytochrome oxidase assembly protein CcoS [Thermithiobacillus plumbiphilus]|uniref:Cbb3-type cytochrome oxidase assembly protein CcoS n=1 Tax=Thermithiobacillus plumbiphilus TaxID=1729899 RepID=A0ABU9D9L8_9PROT